MTENSKAITPKVMEMLKSIPVYPEAIYIKTCRLPYTAPIATDDKGKTCFPDAETKQRYLESLKNRKERIFV